MLIRLPESSLVNTHIILWRRRRDMNPGHIGGRRVLSPLCHPWPPHPQVEVFDTIYQNYDPCEWSSCWLNPISAKKLWWKSLDSSDPFPYHRNTVTEANSSDLEGEREIQAAKNAFGALLPKLEMYIAAVPPSPLNGTGCSSRSCQVQHN